MKILRLFLPAFGPFTNREVVLSPGGQSLTVVYGPNETGKSSALRAITDWRFGIPQQSRDTFIHRPNELRVGALAQAPDGSTHLLVRRKGRNPTLYEVDDPNAELAAERIATPALDHLLTGGLNRAEYEEMYGLDHQRLREGGMALLQGKGEIGATLFQVSAGIRSVGEVLQKLEDAARDLYAPRARNAKLNLAIAAYNEEQQRLHAALVRPAEWSRLSIQHEEAQARVADLNRRVAGINQRIAEVRELRAVAPLIAVIDDASATLNALRSVPVLSESAVADRVAALAGLTEARKSIALAEQEHEAAHARLQQCQPDETVLALAPAISRLVAQAEQYSQTQLDLIQTETELTRQQQQCMRLAHDIDPQATLDEMVGAIPPTAARAVVEHHLRALEQAQGALDHARSSLHRLESTIPSQQAPALPPAEVLAGLDTALKACDRNQHVLQQLHALPAELTRCEHELAHGLHRLGLADTQALLAVRPLLPARIDAETARRDRVMTRIAERETRLAGIERDIAEAGSRRDELLAAGEVPTWADVHALRRVRDELWRSVREHLVRPSASTPPAPAAAVDAVRFESALAAADHVVDALARESERAARLQACLQEIDRLAAVQKQLTTELATLADELAQYECQWDETLTDAGLPALAPAELREWQAQLQELRATFERMQEVRTQAAQAHATATQLREQLLHALRATGVDDLDSDASLDTLVATARTRQATLQRRAHEASVAEGRQAQLKRQRSELELDCADALRRIDQARQALAPFLAQLKLPASADVPAIRARLEEFAALDAAWERTCNARERRDKSRQILRLFEQGTFDVARQLGHDLPCDVRLYIDHLAAALAMARQLDDERRQHRQAMESAAASRRRYQEVARAHQQTLQRLCAAAGVRHPDELPAAEEQSARRQRAQLALDQARSQLVQVTSRSLGELRERLGAHAPTDFEAEEARCMEELEHLQQELEQARKHEQDTALALRNVDSSDIAARAHEAMAQAAAQIEAHVRPWMRLRLAHALLNEARLRFRERAQAPMLRAAERYFEHMTGGEFVRLYPDDSVDQPVLLAQRRNGESIDVEAMSEGTRDQLFLALRLAALDVRREAGVELPVVLDDVLMTSDDRRAGLMLEALARFACNGQVIVFTHHRHLLDVAARHVDSRQLHVVEL